MKIPNPHEELMYQLFTNEGTRVPSLEKEEIVDDSSSEKETELNESFIPQDLIGQMGLMYQLLRRNPPVEKVSEREEVIDEKPKLPALMYDFLNEKGNKASSTVGDPPYREQGATESQAQQKAAGAALAARRGEGDPSKLVGASKALYKGEITTKQLRNLAKLGQNVKKHVADEPKHLKSLPGHVTKQQEEQEYQTRLISAQNEWMKLKWRLRGMDEEAASLKRLAWTYNVPIDEIITVKGRKTDHLHEKIYYRG